MMYYLRWLIFRRFRLAAELCHNAKKLLNHQRDLLTDESIKDLQEAIEHLRQVMNQDYSRKNLDKATLKLQEVGSYRLIPYKNPAFRENVEVGLFAVAIAMGIRTFFFQPMGIPTGSMQPTLYGITESNLTKEDRAVVGMKGFFYSCLTGISHHQLIANGNWRLDDIEPAHKSFILFNRQNFKFKDLDTGETIIRTITPPMNSSGQSYFGLNRISSKNILTKNFKYKPGDYVVNFRRESGDHLLVNRFVYNFRKPKRGEIIVFETKGSKIEAQDQFYIKRLVGLPNETIQINDKRHVVVDGYELTASNHPFEFIYSFNLLGEQKYAQKSHYSGHVNKKKYEEAVHYHNYPDFRTINNYSDGDVKHIIPPNSYFALGDNTMSSSDARSWGHLPGKNIFGTPSFIYWPFFGQPTRIRPDRFGWAFQ